jgi:hypothetical protein
MKWFEVCPKALRTTQRSSRFKVALFELAGLVAGNVETHALLYAVRLYPEAACFDNK